MLLSMCIQINVLASSKELSFRLSFEHYSVENGLSQGTITDMVEDQQGFLWFATFNGLNRFDGYEFKTYYHDVDDNASLPSNLIKKLLIDAAGQLWVATTNGLAKYNLYSDNFTVYHNKNSALKNSDIMTLGLNSDRQLLVADNANLYLFNTKTNDFKIIKTKGLTLPPEIKYIFSEQDKTWIGSFSHGIFLLEHSSNTLYDLSKPNPWNIIVNANYLFEMKMFGQDYWLATDQGAFLIQLTSGQVQNFSASNGSIVADEVRSIIEDGQGQIWLGTANGLSIINPEKNKIFSIDNNNGSNFGLDNSYILKIFKDSKNTLWLGTYAGGIFKYNPLSAKIKHLHKNTNSSVSLSENLVWTIAEGQDNNIWVATQSGGLNRLNPQTSIFEHYLQDFPHNIWDLEIDNRNQLWVASSGGLFVYKQNRDASLQLLSTFFDGTSVENVNLIDNKIWLSSHDNVLRWVEPESLKLKSIQLSNKSIQLVTPIYMDSRNNLWLATHLGLLLFNFETSQLNNLNLEESIRFFSSVYETQDSFWVSSITHGLLKLNKETLQMEMRISTENGLSSNQIINSLLYQDSLWVSTIGGIDEISLATGKVIQNIPPERLNYNEFNQGAALLTQRGTMLFGGSKGLHIFDPTEVGFTAQQNKLTDSQLSPQQVPTITELRIFNRPVSLHQVDSPLTMPINLSTEITLANNASLFSLSFALLNPVDNKTLKFRYQLSGLSDEWIDADPRTRQATFSNLDFGTYGFLVQSRNGLQPWSPSAQLTIHVAPPFWLQNNALLLYVAMAILLLLYWLRQNRIKRASRRAITESEERLQLTLWSSGDELWDWNIYQGEIFRSNTWGTLDFPQDGIRVNSLGNNNIHPNDIKRVQACLREHLEQLTEHYEVSYRTRTHKGEWLWVLDRGKVVFRDSNNQAQRMTGTLKNISHLKVAEEQLKLFKRSIETISDGVFIADTHFRFISVNHSYCKYTGETPEQAVESYLAFHQYPEAFTEEVKKALRQKGNWLGEIESRRNNGDKYEIELNVDAINDEDGKVSHYVGVFSDISARKRSEKELLKLANIDPLTDLPNRSFFQASHSNVVRRNTQHALLCLDMDNFKKINDSLGHQSGDILIKQIAKRLQNLADTSATCYRLGGDEFSIIVENSTDIHRITRLAQTVLDNMVMPFFINQQEFVLGASVGIAFYPEDGSSPQELLKNADTAMYFAKHAGGNKYQFFSGEMNQHAVRQLQIENMIRHGLKEDLFTVFYQPKVDIASGKLVSMEALVRYDHPEKGIISPAQFIPLAEKTGQIIEIGEVVLRKACEDTKRWVDEGLFTGRVAVNISARQFGIPDIDERIESILQGAGLSPLHLECEITESTLMRDPEHALMMMERLREQGIHLALDDFGTGYSSLAYLKKFPLNTLKIDKAFIDDIATSSVDRNMTAAIINIAHNLSLTVVAEGVEYEEQLSILRRYKCEMIQGYLYSKPLTTARFEELLKENNKSNKQMQKNIV
ncbi:MAG: diguanylate cyclase (GGDEF)-like protein/PAS domain S-box-containing protein [Paraglaciecola sp.]|jgi:diguanylate cyclase (GGDEF)-like protein/PAS domain S-box-containing protein